VQTFNLGGMGSRSRSPEIARDRPRSPEIARDRPRSPEIARKVQPRRETGDADPQSRVNLDLG